MPFLMRWFIHQELNEIFKMHHSSWDGFTPGVQRELQDAPFLMGWFYTRSSKIASRCAIPHGMVITLGAQRELYDAPILKGWFLQRELQDAPFLVRWFIQQELNEIFKMHHSSWDGFTPRVQRASRCTIPHEMVLTLGAQRELQDVPFLMRWFIHHIKKLWHDHGNTIHHIS